jgi:hypothetical protein
MALIRDPNWTGPGPGPLIDDGTGSTADTPVTDGRGQFTPEQAAAIDRAAQQAGGAFSGETQQYIDDLQAGRLGGGVDTLNALNILVQQGAAKLATSGGGSSGAVAAGTSGGGTGTVVPKDDNETATTILRNTLKFYGLDQPDLVNEIRAALANRTITGESTVDEIGIQLRESPAFQRRFAANEARRAAGKPVYSVTQTLLLESQYRKNLRDSGMPPGFYDVLKRAARAAEVGAQARKQAGIGLTRETAEELVRQGITEAKAQTGFTTYKQQESLYRPLMGEEEITQEEAIAGTLGTSAQAAQRVGTLKRRRKGTFEAGGKVSLQTIE